MYQAKTTKIIKIETQNLDDNYPLEEYKPNGTVAHQKESFSGDLKELDEKIKSMWTMIKRDGKSVYVCKVCGKEGSYPTHLRDHIEAYHIEGISHPCNYCNKIFKSRHSLGSHKSSKHKVLNLNLLDKSCIANESC